jgi:hypothetical protein
MTAVGRERQMLHQAHFGRKGGKETFAASTTKVCFARTSIPTFIAVIRQKIWIVSLNALLCRGFSKLG